MNDYLYLISGIVFAGLGAELFVRAMVGLSQWARISPAMVSATIAAFATSSPELSVSINSALAGSPQIALGDALGSNVVNIALILAIPLIISGIQCPRDSVKRDFPVAMLVPVITGILFIDGQLSRIDGLLLLGVFVVWLVTVIIEARKQQGIATEALDTHQGWFIVWSCFTGLVLLIIAGNFIVSGARSMALSFGLDDFIVGATLVAIGTSTPELATAVVAKLRKHDDVSLGTLLGSNIFNGLFIVAVAAIIHPITVSWREIAATLLFGLVALLVSYPRPKGFIDRKRGILLLMLYLVYLSAIIKN